MKARGARAAAGDRARISPVAMCEEIGARARLAAEHGQATFAMPEAAPALARLAEKLPGATLRDEVDAWLRSGASYHALVRLCARAVVELDAQWPPAEAHYREKAGGELEPMLSLWPDVLVLPTEEPLAPLEFVELRAFPVHVLGLVHRPAWTDGRSAPPSEFFFHDLDHARFKIREDLRVEGIEIPDAYRDGTTIDAATGTHRCILAHARGRIGGRLWARAADRASLARRLLAASALEHGANKAAVELLLFEIIHEKSFPLDVATLDRELAGDAHLAKLRTKAANRFFPGGTDSAVVEALGFARTALRKVLA